MFFNLPGGRRVGFGSQKILKEQGIQDYYESCIYESYFILISTSRKWFNWMIISKDIFWRKRFLRGKLSAIFVLCAILVDTANINRRDIKPKFPKGSKIEHTNITQQNMIELSE